MDTGKSNTWLVEACPCIRWGLVLRSIIWFSILSSPPILLLSTGTGEGLWFFWFSLIVSLGGWLSSLLAWFGSRGCVPSSSKRPSLSPGNYKEYKAMIQMASGKHKPELALASTETQTSILCLSRRYLAWVLLPPTCTVISHCRQRELPSISQ